MKTIGIILLVFAVGNLITAIIATGHGAEEAAERSLSGALTLGVLGVFLVSRANKKKEDKEKKDKWRKGE